MGFDAVTMQLHAPAQVDFFHVSEELFVKPPRLLVG